MAVVGIDLGTTNTVVACARAGRVQVVGDEQGRRLLPSVVSFHPGGDVLVGHPAKERRVVDAGNTIASVKRLIGRSWDSDVIQRSRQRFAFELRQGPAETPVILARGHEYTLPEISAFVLQRARSIAERALGEAVDRAVITVPANFNELQRAATKVAGNVAGLDVLRIINEPTAAALAYGLGRSARERIAIYDFGGGTFDCTLLDLSGRVFEVLATSGDTFLGGDDLDIAIAERMAHSFLQTHRYDPRADAQAFERLRVVAEGVKIELSRQSVARAKLREVAFGVNGAPMDLDFAMTRDELEVLAAPLVERTFAVCQDALSIARLPVSAFDKVILVGGSTRIPFVRRRVEQFFGAAPLDKINPEEVVAMGAAIQAASLTDPSRIRDVPPPPLPAALREAPPPAQRRPVQTPPAPPSSRALLAEPQDPDEITIATPVVARMAERERSRTPPPPLPRDAEPTLPNPLLFDDVLWAERASGPLVAPEESVPAPLASAPVLVDVTPRALVVETVGGWCDVVVQRNAKIPCERTRAFVTSSDNQTLVKIRVAQGEDAVFEQNTYLGEVELSGLRAAPRGQLTIHVRFEVDESGTLRVAAADVSTGREAHAVLQLVGVSGTASVAVMRTRHAGMQVR
jgi:molecular chaperone DnaK